VPTFASRFIAYACVVLLLPGQWLTLIGENDFSAGIFWVLGVNAVAAAAIGARVPIFSKTDAPLPFAIAEQTPAVQARGKQPPTLGKTLARDVGIVLAGQLVGFYLLIAIAFLLGMITDASMWAAPLLITLIGVIGLGCGMLVGLLIVGPIVAALVDLMAVRKGAKLVPLPIIMALLFLMIFAFAILGNLAIHDSTHLTRGRYFTDIAVALTGVQTSLVTIVSPVLAWLARLAAVLVVVLAGFAAHFARLRLQQGDETENASS
jgi:hypothetical protein